MSKRQVRILFLVVLDAIIMCYSGFVIRRFIYGDEYVEMVFKQGEWIDVLLCSAAVLVSCYMLDLYDLSAAKQRSVLYKKISQASGFVLFVAGFSILFLPASPLRHATRLAGLAFSLAILLCWRLLVQRWIVNPVLAERVLILGTSEKAIDIAREALERREVGYHIVGFIGDDPRLIGKSLINPCVVGVTAQLEDVVKAYQATRLIVAADDRQAMKAIVPMHKVKMRDGVVIEEAASFYERLTGKTSAKLLLPEKPLDAKRKPWVRFYGRVRELADYVVAVVGLVITLPITALTAIAIKLESKGPIFYQQDREGLNGQVFKIFKFRSMRQDAEQGVPIWASVNDDRVTHVGRFIRKFRIDELPQLINILRGEMSLIGPRPERPFFVKTITERIPFYPQRHIIKPGLTGWAQVCYPYGASVDDALEKLQYDLYYIAHQSPFLDLIILAETFKTVLSGRLSR